VSLRPCVHQRLVRPDVPISDSQHSPHLLLCEYRASVWYFDEREREELPCGSWERAKARMRRASEHPAALQAALALAQAGHGTPPPRKQTQGSSKIGS
jgi:hypothetical protein